MDTRVTRIGMIIAAVLLVIFGFYVGHKTVKPHDHAEFVLPDAVATPFQFTMPTPDPIVSHATTRTVVRCPSVVTGTPPVEVEVTGEAHTSVPIPKPTMPVVLPRIRDSPPRYGLDIGLSMHPTLTPDMGSFTLRVAPSARLGDLKVFLGVSVDWVFTSPVPSGAGIFVRKEF